MSLLSIPNLLRLVIETLRSPRETFASLNRLDLPRDALWMALLLTVLISMIFGTALSIAIGPPEQVAEDAPELAVPNPFFLGLAQMAILSVSVVLIDRVGRLMGGSGGFSGAILAVAWLQFVLTCFQIVQSLLMLAAPALGVPLFAAGLVVFFWLLTCFVTELHGFSSLGRVFGMIVFVMIGLALGLSLILTLLGVTVTR